jgi:hypothetical protein
MTTDNRLDADMPAAKIIGKWGTNARFARALGKTASTTDRWLKNGHIPGEHHGDVVAAARRDDIVIRPTDFVDMRLFEGVGEPEARAA